MSASGRLPLALPAAWPNGPRPGTSGASTGQSGDGQSRSLSSRLPRVGRRDLTRLAEQLRDRDCAVLDAVAEHRCLLGGQVERLVFTEHTSSLSAARTARRVLRRLATFGLLRTLERRVGGVRAGSSSYVWQLAPAGQRLVARGGSARRLHEPSERLLAHYLAVAEVSVRLREAARAGRFELLCLDLEPTSWRRHLGSGGEPRLLRPDLYAVTATAEFEDHWFLEVDLGSEHPPTVVRQCRGYLDYQRTGQEQAVSGVFPRVVWQVPDDARAERLAAAFRAARLDSELFKITTHEHLVEVVAGGAA